MIPKYQRYPNECFAACVASLMHTNVADIPALTDKPGMWLSAGYEVALRRWLNDNGCGGYVEFGFPLALPDLLANMRDQATSVWYILTGLNKAGRTHSVLCYGGEIRHDPGAEKHHHTIAGPCEDGFFRVGFLLHSPQRDLTSV